MKLAEGVRRHGFRKWYERELLRSHGHLALTFLCLIGVFAVFESMRTPGSSADRAWDLLSLLLCAAIGVWTLRRYLYLLSRAEGAAHQAECQNCKAYGRLELLQADATGDAVQVRCRRCSHSWPMQA